MAYDISTATPKLFGMPYQFPDTVDHREKGISTSIGRKYIDTILVDAPICTIIPGEPRYMPGQSSQMKTGMAAALFENDASFSNIAALVKDNPSEAIKLYDFKTNYTDYMKYVNVLCRTGAIFLGLGDKKIPTADGSSESLKHYDWRQYRYTTTQTKGIISQVKTAVDHLINKEDPTSKSNILLETAGLAGDDDALNEMVNYPYVQFYVDISSDVSEDISNSTTDSMFRGLVDQKSETFRELGYMLNSSEIAKFVSGSAEAFKEGVTGILSSACGDFGNAVSSIINLGSETLRGNNVILPAIYQSSDYSKRYNVVIDLKAPYGTAFGYYMDIFVPLMHIVALALPRQQTSNSYGSPFLVKAYIDGTFSCNLGIVTSVEISKEAESYSVAGLPSEVKVSLTISDLYTDLSMSPSSSPTLFLNNSSLIEWLATNCGVSLVTPNVKKKINMFVSTYVSAIEDIPSNIHSVFSEKANIFIGKILGQRI